jgi:outer membrane biogenesis lipoprotein LolB
MKTQRILLSALACILISACGVSETAVTAAAVGTAKAKELEQGKQQMEQIKQQVEANTQQVETQRQAMESAAQ